MEGSTWLRIGAIAALFLGSIYVLAPTVLQEDIEVQRARAAAGIDAPEVKTSAKEMVFETTAPDASVPIVTERLKARSLKAERVLTADGKLIVHLAGGTKRDVVESLLARPGEVSLYSAGSIAPLPEPLPPIPPAPTTAPGLWSALQAYSAEEVGHWGVVASLWAQRPVPAGVQPLSLSLDSFDGNILHTSGTTPDDVPFLVVAIDAKMVGLGFPAGDGYKWEPLQKSIGSAESVVYVQDEDAKAILQSGPLPAPLTLESVEQAAAEKSSTDANLPEPAFPAWFTALFPDTVMQLGLDLQGGLDITLQVELDDAVLGQVARDAQGIKQQLEREKVAFEVVKKDRIEPIIWFTGVDSAKLTELMRTTYPGYVIDQQDQDSIGYRLTDARQTEIKKQAVDQVLETLRKRVDGTGVKEPSIVKKGGGKINVQLPGAVDLQAAVDAIGTTAQLEFRLVDMKFDQALLSQILAAAEDALSEEEWKEDLTVNQWLWDSKRLELDRQIFWFYNEVEKDGKKVMERDDRRGALVLLSEVMLTGNDVNKAVARTNVGVNETDVILGFKPRGAKIFCDVTTEHVKDRFGIILDGQLRSAPSIRERICGGQASIGMGNSLNAQDDANTLALVLRTGSLDAPVSIGEVRQVGASLGHDAIRAGSIASVVGGLIVLVFMALWYRKAGMIANVALALNVLLVLAALAAFGATLTLPGIAGIALTIGMAVDANIIIFERIREELAMGVHPRKAVDEGFSKGLVAVLDANITTAIAGVVLYSYGTGPIKGFAVTLLIGILTTLVTALFVTRTLMGLATRSSSSRISI